MASANQISIATAAPAPGPALPARLSFLMNPLVDKIVALVACGPFLWQLYANYRRYGFDTPRVFLALHLLAFVLPSLFRRTPVRVTPNPLYWLLAFVATYWNLMTAGFVAPGHPLVSREITGLIILLGTVILLMARANPARNPR